MDYEKKYKEALEVAKRKLCFDKAGMVDSFTPNDIYEMFPELKESEEERIRKDIVEAVELHKDFTQKRKEYIYAWLEKQGEQKPVDKAEPKFNVGDWIIDVQGVSENQIIGYEDDSYYIETSCSKFYLPMKLAEKNYRLWTIQDAKDGDVLVNKHGCPLIFKDRETCWCYYSISSEAFRTTNNRWFFSSEDYLCPATKEQRDTLIKAMSDAGYAFDFDKKELKKIDSKLNDDSVSNELRAASFTHAKKEILNHTFPNDEEFELIYTFEEGAKWNAAQKHNWSDEDEEELKIALNTLEEAGQYSSAKWLKNVCLVPQTIQKPTEWSEEDEGILDEIIDFLENGTVKLQHDLSLYASWLKSLKDRYAWKPSDEQMDALEYHLKHTNENSRLYKETKKLYDQLKKL